jgi:hypothetical protein
MRLDRFDGIRTVGGTILLRTSEADSLGLDAEAFHSIDHVAIEIHTAITCIVRSLIVNLSNDNTKKRAERADNFVRTR